jgi:hypothetical protein
MIDSPNGKAVLTLKKKSGLAAAILTMVTTTTLPSLYAAGIAVPVWVPIALGALLGACVIVGQWGSGVRVKRTKTNAPGLVAVNVPPEAKP